MANSTVKISKQDFDKLLLELAESRPCSFYLHGVRPTYDDTVLTNVIQNGEDFLVRGRKFVFTTFVDAGAIDDNLQNRITEYEYTGGRYNIIMITPDFAEVKNYAGGVEEISAINLEFKKWPSHVWVDYIVAGANKFFNPEENQDACMSISSVTNKFILGYYDRETGEYIINKNCIVFDSKEEYDKAIEQITNYATEYYHKSAVNQLFTNFDDKYILSKFQNENMLSIRNKICDILLCLAGEFYEETTEYVSYLKPYDVRKFHSCTVFPSLYHALIDMINSNEIMPDLLVEILKETNGDTNKLKDNSNYKILLTYAEGFLEEETKILFKSLDPGISV